MLLRRRFVPAYLLDRHMTFVSCLEAYARSGGPYDPDSNECFHSL